ncbi:MAG TPA: cell division protein FtsA [Candidatus Paceibacterota bacterium]|nr:cell division protein FtsA [Candidatus Paceibacterota bacterium]
MQSHTITGIDIGNATVKVAVARVDPHAQQPEIIGVGTASSTSGLDGGEVVDVQESVNNVRAALADASAMAGVPIRRAWVGASGVHVAMQSSRGVIAVGRADQEIGETDVKRVIDAAAAVSLPPNRELIHVIPREFVIDDSEHVHDPIGMKGVRLEADVTLVHGPSRHLRNLAKVVNECGVEVAGFVFAPLAASLSSVDKHQKQFGVAHLDVGGGTCSLTVWDKGDMLHAAILPLGSVHITRDLAIMLRTSLDVAERIKTELGAVNEPVDKRRKPEVVDLTSYMDETYAVDRRKLMQAIDARADEVMDMVATELKKCGRAGKLPAGVVVSGGGSKLNGILPMVRDGLGLPVRGHRLMGVDAFDAATDPSFAVAIGLILWEFNHEVGETGQSSSSMSGTGWIRRAGDWLKNFLP